jgi:fumarate hydratase class I
MTTKAFHYEKPFPLAADDTEYRLVTKDHVRVETFQGQEVLVVEPEALELLANEATKDIAFMLRTSHLKQVAAILDDPEASENDRYVALTLLRNAEVAAKGILPFCQDTGTAMVMAKKGQQVWTGGGDEAALSKGIYKTYTEENLRYSQTVPLDMFKEVNSGTNLPAQIDIMAADGASYDFLFVAKGGGSANKTCLYLETKALL